MMAMNATRPAISQKLIAASVAQSRTRACALRSRDVEHAVASSQERKVTSGESRRRMPPSRFRSARLDRVAPVHADLDSRFPGLDHEEPCIHRFRPSEVAVT